MNHCFSGRSNELGAHIWRIFDDFPSINIFSGVLSKGIYGKLAPAIYKEAYSKHAPNAAPSLLYILYV
jgi:hypothetical protein